MFTQCDVQQPPKTEKAENSEFKNISEPHLSSLLHFAVPFKYNDLVTLVTQFGDSHFVLMGSRICMKFKS